MKPGSRLNTFGYELHAMSLKTCKFSHCLYSNERSDYTEANDLHAEIKYNSKGS